MDQSIFLTYLFSLFAILNPLGAIPIFVSLTKDFDSQERRSIAVRTSLYVTLVLIISFLIGDYLLKFFGVDIVSLKIAGGIIIALSGFSLMKSKLMEHKGIIKKTMEHALSKEDPSITPLTTPILAGPGAISYLISLNGIVTGALSYSLVVLMIVVSGLGIGLTLSLSHVLAKRMGPTGLSAMSRFVGFLIIAIGIQYILSAMSVYVKSFS